MGVCIEFFKTRCIEVPKYGSLYTPLSNEVCCVCDKEESIDNTIKEYLEPIEDEKESIEREYKELQRIIDEIYLKVFRLVDSIRYLMESEVSEYYDSLINKYTDTL